MNAVKMPIGISVARRFLDTLSTTSRNAAPSSIVAGTRYRWSLPTILRARCGITSPTQPIMPLTDTLDAVTSVEQSTTISRSRLGCTPMVRASSSPSVRIFMRQRSKSSGMSPNAIGSSTNETSCSRAPDRLPMSQ